MGLLMDPFRVLLTQYELFVPRRPLLEPSPSPSSSSSSPSSSLSRCYCSSRISSRMQFLPSTFRAHSHIVFTVSARLALLYGLVARMVLALRLRARRRVGLLGEWPFSLGE